MSSTIPAHPRDQHRRHAVLLGLGAVFLTGAVLYFNGSYGATFSWGMMAAFLGFAIVKDAGISYAWAASGQRGRVAAALLGGIGFVISCLAAIGAASHGRQEMSDPKAAQIAAYAQAARTAAEAEAKLSALGVTHSADQARARQAALTVDAAIFRRTQSCTQTVNAKSTRQTAANAQACQPWREAAEAIAAAEESDRWQAKLDAARAVMAKGKPASADAQATTLAALLSVFTALKGIEGIQAWTNLLIGLGLEIASPLAWAAYASALSGKTRPLATGLAGPASPAVPASSADREASFQSRKAAALAEPSEPSSLVGLFGGDIPERDSAEIVPFPRDPNGSPNGSGPKGGGRARPGRLDAAESGRARKELILADIRQRQANGERFDSQEDLRAALAERFGPLAKSTLSNWLDELTVPRAQRGRCKAVG